MAKKQSFSEATKSAISKARELGYAGLRELEATGTTEHKVVVKNAFDSYLSSKSKPRASGPGF